MPVRRSFAARTILVAGVLVAVFDVLALFFGIFATLAVVAASNTYDRWDASIWIGPMLAILAVIGLPMAAGLAWGSRHIAQEWSAKMIWLAFIGAAIAPSLILVWFVLALLQEFGA